MKKIYFQALFLLLALWSVQSNAQTTLIDPNTNGGFESGSDFPSNGWTVVNGSVTNKWFVGTVPAGFTNNVAYVSNNATGTTWTYTNTSISVVHFYRDVTFPAGESDVTLSFNWQALGESGSYDALMVSIAPTTYTPAASSTSLSTGTLASPANTLVQLWNQNSVQTATIKIPASALNNCSAASTLRLIFTWKNDGSGGTNPPAAIDNISLISQNPAGGRITGAGGTFTIDNTLPNSGNNFTTFTEAVNALNAGLNFCTILSAPIVFNVAANQVFNEIVPTITASGTAANTITFQKGGSGANPVVLRNDAGTLTTSSMGGQGDAVISVTGGDYINFNQIDVSATDQGIEYGYLLRKENGTNGCKNVTIKNASITMTKGTSAYVTGIYSSNLDPSSAVSSATGVTVTTTGGRHENVTITGNTISNVFYGIQLRGFAHSSSPYDFYDQNFVVGAGGTGNSNTINNFGGQSTTTVYGIYVIQHNAISVNYNTIKNTDNGGTNSTGTMYGIYFGTGTTSAFTANNNDISLTTQYASGSLYGIYNNSTTSGFTGNIAINNNTISLNNAAASSGTFAFIYNGSATAATEVSFSNNVFAASTFNTTGTAYLIYNSVTNAATVTVQNNKTVGSIQKDGNSTVYGYYSAASPTGVENFYNNNFSDITAGGTSSFYGYYSNTAAAHRRNVYSNVVSNINAGGTTVAGIWKGIGGSNIYSNKIWNLTSTNTGTTTSVSGIFLNSGTKDSIYNNIVGDLFATGAANPTNSVVGIQSASSSTTSTIGIYFNTINLNASSSGTNFGTSGISLTGSTTATTAAVEMKNNIIVNNSTPNGTGYTAVLRRITSSSLANLTNSTNNNLLYTNSPGGNTALYFYDATIVDYTLQDFKNRMSPRGSASIYENPNFVSVTGSDPTYLHINTAIATQIESGGSPVGGITADFDGDTRNATTPDIGADEFNGMGIDLSAPSITYTPLAAGCSTGDRVVSGITITDASGVPTTGSLVPRIYYKKSTGATWFSKPGTLASGTGTNGSWNFTIVAADMGTLALGDVVQYFVIAQDIAGTPNVGSNPSGATASNVNTVTVYPATPNSYIIGTSLNGAYTVGATGTFTSLTQAVAVYNGCPLTGATTFNLVDASYPENFPVTIGVNASASAVNTLTIKPASGNNVLISGTTATGSSIIKLDGADYIIIDGSNNGTASRNLTIENMATVSSAGIWVASLGGAGNGANNNTIKNVNIFGAAPNTSNIFGIVSGASSSFTTAGEDNDNLVIENDSITKVYTGVSVLSSSTTGLTADGLIIRKNSIGDANDPSNSIAFRGIQLSYATNPMIIANKISNVRTSSSFSNAGIDIGAGVTNSEIRRNMISGIYSTSTSGYGAYGINFSSATGTSDAIVANNFISDIITSNYLTSSTTFNAFGIRITGGNNIKVYYNSVHMAGNVTGGTSAGMSAGLMVLTTAVTGLDIRNNIFSNSTNFAVNGSFAYGIYFSSTPVAPIVNYNDYYGNSSSSTTFRVGYGGGAAQATLANWQTFTTQDANSKNVDPLFMSTTDLHLQASSTLDQMATPLASVTIDIDEQPRDASIPDIGADEINVTNCAGAIGGNITAGNTSLCAGDSTIVSAAGFSTGTGSGYQWEVSTNNVNFTPVAGATTPSPLNTKGLAATTYYRLKVTCSSGTAIAYSDTATVTVNQIPTVTVSPAGPVNICAPATQQLTVTNTSASSPLYQWTMNGNNVGGNTASYTASASGSYAVKVTDGTTSCFKVSASVLVTINAQPSAMTITPSAASLCSTTDPAQMLTVTGGTVSGVTILSEDFNGATNSWTTINNSTGGSAPTASAWTLRPDGYVYNTTYPTAYHSNDNSQFYHTNADAPGSGSSTAVILQSPAFNTVGFASANLSFYHYYKYRSTDTAHVEVSTNGTAWTRVAFYTASDQGSYAAFANVNIDLSAYVGQSSVYVRFRNISAWGYWWAIDNVSITGSQTTNITWSPVTGLYTNAAATTPYTGTATATVYAKPNATITYTATATSISNCTNTKTVTITSNCPVPVTLVNFAGEKQGSINKLMWTTSTEVNNAGFELERSADGKNFSKLSFIASKADGNSNQTLNYVYYDERPLMGNGYYRLKQVDKDGKFTYSNIVLLKGDKVKEVMITSIYPNPAESELNLVITSPTSEKVTLVVTDITGKVISQSNLQLSVGDNLQKLQVGHFASGTYFVKTVCINGCESVVQKFMKK